MFKQVGGRDVLTLATCLDVRGMSSKVRLCQLMRQSTAVGLCWRQGQETGNGGRMWVWLCGGCVATPTQEVTCVGGAVEWP